MKHLRKETICSRFQLKFRLSQCSATIHRMDVPKPLSLMESVECFIRLVYAELLQNISKTDGNTIGPESRVLGDVIYGGSFLGELNDLEEHIYAKVRKDGYISKSAAEAILHRAIESAVLSERKL